MNFLKFHYIDFRIAWFYFLLLFINYIAIIFIKNIKNTEENYEKVIFEKKNIHNFRAITANSENAAYSHDVKRGSLRCLHAHAHTLSEFRHKKNIFIFISLTK